MQLFLAQLRHHLSSPFLTRPYLTPTMPHQIGLMGVQRLAREMERIEMRSRRLPFVSRELILVRRSAEQCLLIMRVCTGRMARQQLSHLGHIRHTARVRNRNRMRAMRAYQAAVRIGQAPHLMLLDAPVNVPPVAAAAAVLVPRRPMLDAPDAVGPAAAPFDIPAGEHELDEDLFIYVSTFNILILI